MDTNIGVVTTYSSKVTPNGSFECSVELVSENATISEISSNWKGIFFMCENDEHCIPTDGLSKNQKQIIVEGLENYPTFLS